MSEIKIGDRVHVEFDGAVVMVNTDGSFEVEYEGVRLHPDYIPRVAVTRILPPIKVGDIVTAENIGQVPEHSIVARDGEYLPLSRSERGWRISDNCHLGDDAVLGTRVLRIGGGDQ